MEQKIKDIVDITKKKFGLSNYYLKNYDFYRRINLFNETIYTLNMEWFPEGTDYVEEELNPIGTAIIDMNLQSEKFEQVIFVQGTSYAINGVSFENKENIIQWVENETGLKYGDHFQLEKEEKGKYIFQAYINGVKVSPIGDIEVKIDQEGNLTLFSIIGHFPTSTIVKKEKFNLSLEDLQPIIKEQLKLIEIPIFEERKIVPIYCVEEVFISNDGTTTIPIDAYSKSNHINLDETITWDEPIDGSFERNLIDINEKITAEEAFTCAPSPDTYPITVEELMKCKKVIKQLLQQVYSLESGNWVLNKIYRENGYILGILEAKKQGYHVFHRKLQVFINPKTFKVENYIDSKHFLETFDDYEIISEINISKKESYKKLKSRFNLTPTYVYNNQLKQFILCGKLNCTFGINAVNGEIINLNKI